MLLENEKIEGKALQDLMRETQDESSENLES
jgi:hypothetical protein